MTYVIAQPCVDLKDRACVDEWPVEAISYEDDVPEEYREFHTANVEFFADLGSPDGASRTGLLDRDHPLLAALPPQEHDGH
jgi:hypothetical protein